ncbi:PucR family transcriptional regulator [Streptomyces halobius]|uniref:Helix-turn-helix domain-containing protein n=1 Tax=Streptomyces halobius TaxID=2879846 RepID=A0ABY4MHU3_9ACTN|nr:helix-turn-helix domain-containing protein [Streptomyces halobius]UQA97313.1 helix-turn-helix domain-containing protein [Streptomyces halobius]
MWASQLKPVPGRPGFPSYQMNEVTMGEATTSDARGGVCLSERGGTRDDGDQRAVLAELITRSLSDHTVGFRSFIERAGHAQVARLVEEALRNAVASGARPSDAEHAPGRTTDELGDGVNGGGNGDNCVDLRRPASSQQARRALFSALTGEGAIPTGMLGQLSRRADWPLPGRVRAIALRTRTDIHLVASALGDCLISAPEQEPCLLVPVTASPLADEKARLHGVLRCRSAAVGHAVPLHDAAASVRWACRLLELVRPGVGPGGGVVFVDDHVSSLLLLQDKSLLRALVARQLRPLAGLTPDRCARLEATLLAWLGGGGAPEIAKALSIHPQTVRYRMRQIEKLFGSRLRDPRTRFEIQMALRSRLLLANAHRRSPERNRRARAGARPCRLLSTAPGADVNGL